MMAFLRFIVASLFAASAQAQYLEPELRVIAPTGAQRGATVEITAVGERLEPSERLHFSHPGIQGTRKTESATFEVTISPEVPPGRYDARVVGRTGVSNPRSFLVSPLVNQVHAQPSHDPLSGLPLGLEVLGHGVAVAAQVDYYTVAIDSAKSLRIELIAARLDSRIIGRLVLMDAGGNEIASARGADGVDPILEVEALEPGKYTIAVNDFLYRGGEDYRYQVVAREMPLVSDLGVMEFREPESLTSRPLSVLASPPRIAGSPEHLELPHDGSYVHEPGKSTSVFEFSAAAGQSIAIDAVSQRAGEPTDLRLRLRRAETDASGVVTLHEVHAADDSQEITDGVVQLSTRDPVTSWVVPATATYQLEVRDLDRGESIKSVKTFRLRVHASEPGFDLVAYRLYPHQDLAQSRPHGSRLSRAGAETIRVLAVRRDGWSGAIEVRIDGLAEGVTSAPVIMSANQSQTQLTVVARDDAATSLSSVRIIGRAVEGSIERQAVPVTFVATKGGGRDFLPTRICDELLIAVDDTNLAPMSIGLESPNGVELETVKQGEALTLTLRITRREGGNEAITIRPRDLPPGVTAADVVIAADASASSIVLNTSAAAIVGTYSLWVQAETTIKASPDAASLVVFIPSSTLTFRVIEP